VRIALINEPWNGGASRCARDLRDGLKANHEVWLCPDGVAPRAREVLGLLRNFKPDVVHLHAFYGWLGYETLAAVAREFPTAYTPHDPRPIGQIEPACWDCTRNTTCLNCPLITPVVRYTLVKHRYFHQRLKRQWVHRRTPRSLEVIGVSQWFVERMRQQEMRRFRLRHLPNGVDPAIFRPVADAKQRLGLDDSTDLILFLSTPATRWRVNERKGMLPLAEAFLDQVAARFPRAVLGVAGDLLVPNHPRVRGLGYIAKADLPLWYSAAAVYVLPSMGDNLPYTVLEAMSCGCPVIATDVGGIPEQVDHGKTGLLMPDNSPANIASALTSILEDGARARAMGQAGRKKILAHYTLDHFLSRHEALYRGMASGSSRPPRSELS
jgi:glycosyltransferase involved in cell wall biosynthesis